MVMAAVVVVAIALAVEAVVLTVAVKSLVWAGEVIDTLGEVLGALTIAFGVPLVSPTLYVLTSFGVDLVLDANVEAYVVVMTVDFVMPEPSEGFRSCGAAIDCQLMAALDCAHVLQARMPSYHV